MRLGPIGRTTSRDAAEPPRAYAGIEILPADPQHISDRRPLGEAHVLVCVAGEAGDCELIRQGRVLADLVAGRLTVLYAFRIGKGDRQRHVLSEDRSYARTVGAQLVELPAYSAEAGVAEYARARAVTHIVLSEARSSDSLVEQLTDVDWYFVLGADAAASPD